MKCRSRVRLYALVLFAVAIQSVGCAPTKEGIKNRQAANDRMNAVGAQVHHEQAMQMLSTGQLDKALREVDKAIARYPNAGEYHLTRGRILLEQHRLEPALESFNTAAQRVQTLQSANEAAASNIALATVAADAQYYAGVVYQRWSDDEQALECYRAASKLCPDKVHYLLAAAESQVALGEFAQAREMIEPRLAYFEHNASLRQLLAQIAMLEQDPTRAAELYGQARLLNPDDPSLLRELAWSQYASAQYAKCLDSIAALERMDHQPRANLIHMRARCLAMTGRTVEARTLYLELSNMQGSDPIVWSELGTLAWELGDYRTLAQASVQLMAIAPDRYEGYLFRAINERRKGHAEETLRLLRESCHRATGVPLPFVLLGQTLEGSGDLTGAREAYNQALAADPDSSEAKTLLRRLNEQQQMTVVPVQ